MVPLSRRVAPLFGHACVALLFALLQAAINAGLVDGYTVPLPTEVLASLPRLVAEEHIVRRFGITAAETLAAGLLAMLVGVAKGAVLYRSPRLRRAFEPWVAVFAAAPLVLAYPLFLVLFGRSPVTIVVIAFASAVGPVILKTVEGFSAVRPVLLAVGRSFGLRRFAEFRLILFPAALPHIFTGLRLALVFALINVVGVEFLINLGGLGALINELAERYDLPGTWAAILVVVLVSVCFFALLDGAERWLRRRG
jgi:NitT/TauT family transport system permease protein